MTRFVLQCVLLSLGFATLLSVDGLTCYQCATSMSPSPCINDYEGLLNTTKNWTDTDIKKYIYMNKYKKDCSASNDRWDRCVIESHLGQDGKVTYFKRDCHDGKTFHSDFDDAEFHNLTANNFTTCAYTQLKVVCLTFCQSDFCNGPQPSPDFCEGYDPDDNTTSPELQSYCGVAGLHDGNSVVWLLQLVALSAAVWAYISVGGWHELASI